MTQLCPRILLSNTTLGDKTLLSRKKTLLLHWQMDLWSLLSYLLEVGKCCHRWVQALWQLAQKTVTQRGDTGLWQEERPPPTKGTLELEMCVRRVTTVSVVSLVTTLTQGQILYHGCFIKLLLLFITERCVLEIVLALIAGQNFTGHIIRCNQSFGLSPSGTAMVSGRDSFHLRSLQRKMPFRI